MRHNPRRTYRSGSSRVATKTGEIYQMTEKQQSEKKPIWESIDEKDVEEEKRRYFEDIGAAKSRLEDYKGLGDDPAI